jgi:hypothetical protein
MCSRLLKRHRSEAARQQDFRCWYCTFPIWNADPDKFARRYRLPAGLVSRFRCTAEHLWARSMGGSNAASNIVAACAFCNHTRHKRKCPSTSEQHRITVAKRISQGRWHPLQAHKVLGVQIGHT